MLKKIMSNLKEKTRTQEEAQKSKLLKNEDDFKSGLNELIRLKIIDIDQCLHIRQCFIKPYKILQLLLKYKTLTFHDLADMLPAEEGVKKITKPKYPRQTNTLRLRTYLDTLEEYKFIERVSYTEKVNRKGPKPINYKLTDDCLAKFKRKNNINRANKPATITTNKELVTV